MNTHHPHLEPVELLILLKKLTSALARHHKGLSQKELSSLLSSDPTFQKNLLLELKDVTTLIQSLQNSVSALAK